LEDYPPGPPLTFVTEDFLTIDQSFDAGFRPCLIFSKDSKIKRHTRQLLRDQRGLRARIPQMIEAK
jgi:hypothetical protein